MSSPDASFDHHGLYYAESPDKIFGIVYRRYFASNSIHYLAEAASAKSKRIFRELNIDQFTLVDGLEHRLHHFPDIAYFSDGRDNHSPWCEDIFSIRVLLRHRKGVLSSWNIDSKGYCELADGLHCPVKPHIFTGVFCRPHPVGTQRDTFQPMCQRCPDQVGEGFCHRQHRSPGRIR